MQRLLVVLTGGVDDAAAMGVASKLAAHTLVRVVVCVMPGALFDEEEAIGGRKRGRPFKIKRWVELNQQLTQNTISPTAATASDACIHTPDTYACAGSRAMTPGRSCARRRSSLATV
jgi:hypothetical protein